MSVNVIIFNEAALYQQVRFRIKGPEHISRLAEDRRSRGAVQLTELGRIVAIPQVGGLHHRYE